MASWLTTTLLLLRLLLPLPLLSLCCCCCCRCCNQVKFLSAMSRCRFVLAPSWWHACVARNAFVDEAAHVLTDKAGEAKFGFSLTKALATTRGKLFDGACANQKKKIRRVWGDGDDLEVR